MRAAPEQDLSAMLSPDTIALHQECASRDKVPERRKFSVMRTAQGNGRLGRHLRQKA
jgi:hypothetical protein